MCRMSRSMVPPMCAVTWPAFDLAVFMVKGEIVEGVASSAVVAVSIELAMAPRCGRSGLS